MAAEPYPGTKLRFKFIVNEIIDNLKLTLSFVDDNNKENNIVATVNNGLTYTQDGSKTYYFYEQFFSSINTNPKVGDVSNVNLTYTLNRGSKYKEITDSFIVSSTSLVNGDSVIDENGDMYDGLISRCDKEFDATNWTPNVINYSFGLAFTSNVEIPSLAINISAQYDTSTIISQSSTPTNGLTYNNGVYSMSFTGDNSTTLQQMEGTVPITVSISANKYKPFTESFIINNMADKPENGGLYIKQYSIDQLTPIKEYVNYLHMNGCVHYGNHLVRYGGIIS